MKSPNSRMVVDLTTLPLAEFWRNGLASGAAAGWTFAPPLATVRTNAFSSLLRFR